MPGLTLHLYALHPNTPAPSFLQHLRKTTRVIVASRPRHIVIHPTILDADLLTREAWDLLVLRDPTPSPLPDELQSAVRKEYTLTVGVPSKLLSSYPERDARLKQHASSIPLTGSLEQARGKSSSQNLELSPALLTFMDKLTREHTGPVTMLNLLHFNHPDGKKSYYNYGQAFIPVAGKRGGDAKLVGNVVAPQPGRPDSRGEHRAEREWWNEISIVHYPSIRHFCDMLAGEDYQEINERFRLGALRDTFLLCTTEIDDEKARL